MSALDNLKALASFARKSKDPELLDQVITLQTAYLELVDRLQNLEKENGELKEALTIKESLSVKDGVYFSGDDGPFCTRCWDVIDKLVRLMVRPVKVAICPECDTTFKYLSVPQKPITSIGIPKPRSRPRR